MYYFPSLHLPGKLDAYRNKHYLRRKSRLEYDLLSLKLAYENLKEDAALEYVHINKTDVFDEKLTIITKTGQKFYLDLNDVIFILQKKASHFFRVFENSTDLYRKHLLSSFIKMADRRSKKMIIDDDIGRKRRNWAIIDNEVVNIDVGRWYFDEKLIYGNVYQKEMLKATKTLRKYLSENYSYLLYEFNEILNSYIKEYKVKHPKNF